eukprot:GHVN01022881.1.p1 GENE.GHVN01022881.1~~GHVN01022881.1.p1  ORF type:complete len:683 (-),score=221.03 GHVN01022881.1:209-2257(-)
MLAEGDCLVSGRRGGGVSSSTSLTSLISLYLFTSLHCSSNALQFSSPKLKIYPQGLDFQWSVARRLRQQAIAQMADSVIPHVRQSICQTSFTSLTGPHLISILSSLDDKNPSWLTYHQMKNRPLVGAPIGEISEPMDRLHHCIELLMGFTLRYSAAPLPLPLAEQEKYRSRGQRNVPLTTSFHLDPPIHLLCEFSCKGFYSTNSQRYTPPHLTDTHTTHSLSSTPLLPSTSLNRGKRSFMSSTPLPPSVPVPPTTETKPKMGEVFDDTGVAVSHIQMSDARLFNYLNSQLSGPIGEVLREQLTQLYSQGIWLFTGGRVAPTIQVLMRKRSRISMGVSGVAVGVRGGIETDTPNPWGSRLSVEPRHEGVNRPVSGVSKVSDQMNSKSLKGRKGRHSIASLSAAIEAMGLNNQRGDSQQLNKSLLSPSPQMSEVRGGKRKSRKSFGVLGVVSAGISTGTGTTSAGRPLSASMGDTPRRGSGSDSMDVDAAGHRHLTHSPIPLHSPHSLSASQSPHSLNASQLPLGSPCSARQPRSGSVPVCVGLVPVFCSLDLIVTHCQEKQKNRFLRKIAQEKEAFEAQQRAADGTDTSLTMPTSLSNPTSLTNPLNLLKPNLTTSLGKPGAKTARQIQQGKVDEKKGSGRRLLDTGINVGKFQFEYFHGNAKAVRSLTSFDDMLAEGSPIWE